MTKERHHTITQQADWQGALRAAQGQGELPVRALARAVGRDVKRVHDDVAVPAELGLLKRTASGGLPCPFASLHIDMHLKAAA